MKNNKCFAYDEKHDCCKALTVLECKNCKFFKTKTQFKKEYERGRKRLEELKKQKEMQRST